VLAALRISITTPKIQVASPFHLLVPMFLSVRSLVALRPLDEKHGVKKMGTKR